MRRSQTTDPVTIPADLLADAIDALELVGCQFWACEGETLEPIDMVTCRRCAVLARLHVLVARPNPGADS